MIDRYTNAVQAFKQRPNYWIAILLPIYFAIIQLYLRSQAGPFWQWNLLDPSYFYLFDGLNLLNGATPGHVYHPGVTVHAFNAILIWLHELITSDHALRQALLEPEHYLYFLSDAIIIINSLALVVVGLVGHRILGGWLPALICQLAPFTSSIILKHAFLPKPEALLVFSTIAIISLSLVTLREGLSSSFRDRLGIGFGIILGFVLATKITAAPMFLLPLFLLRKVRPILIFFGITTISFAFFFLPAWGAAEHYLDWLIRVANASGPYGSGSKGIIDVENYLSGFVKILKRPSLKIPMVFALLSVGLTAWRSWNGWKIEVKDMWVVLGVSAVQLGQAIVVAKQPTAFYMIPSYMLASVSLLFSMRMFWHATPYLWKITIAARTIGSLLFAGFIAAQTWGVSKLAGHLEMVKHNSTSVDNSAFKDCARIYNYAASAPIFAAYLADHVTGSRLSGDLRQQFSENEFWIDDWWDWEPVRLKNWDGEHDIMSVINRYPCVLIRGTRRDRVNEYLKAHAKGIKFNTHCSKGEEIIRVHGVDCSGRPTK